MSVNQQIELPDLKVTKKVKSMQMFRKPVNKAIQGDRVGLCIAQLDAKVGKSDLEFSHYRDRPRPCLVRHAV